MNSFENFASCWCSFEFLNGVGVFVGDLYLVIVAMGLVLFDLRRIPEN